MNSNTPLNAPRPRRTALPLWGMAVLVLTAAPCRPALADPTPGTPAAGALHATGSAVATPATNPARTDPTARLLEAVKVGDAAAVRAALAAGADANATFKGEGYGEVPALMLAVHQGRADVVGALLERGADVNRRGPRGTPVLFSAVVSSASIPAMMQSYSTAMQARQMAAMATRRSSGHSLLGGLLGGGGLGGMITQGALMYATGGLGGMLGQGLASHAAQNMAGQAVRGMAVKAVTQQVEGQAVQALAGRMGGAGPAALLGAALPGGANPQALAGQAFGALAGGRLRAAPAQASREPSHAATADTAGPTPQDSVALLRLLIAHGADVNAQDEQGLTALDIAQATSRADLAEILKQSGAKESERGKTFERLLHGG